jgi:serine/threonine-protein kinase
MRAIVEEPFAPPSQFRAEAPDDLAEIVMKALDKDPDERFPSALAMREALGAVGEGAKSAPAGAVPASAAAAETADAPQASATSSPARRPWVKVLAGALALVLTLLGGGYGLWASGASDLPLPNMSLSGMVSSANGDAPTPEGTSNAPPNGTQRTHTPRAETARSSRNSNAAGEADSASHRAQLTIETTPSGAQVYLDGRSVGSTPLQDHSVDRGSLAVRLETPDRPAVDTLLHPEAGQALALRLSLPAAPAASADSSAPSRAASSSEETPAPPESDAPERTRAENDPETTPDSETAPAPSEKTAQASPSPAAPTDPGSEADDGAAATLTVGVEPEGSVEWNGKRRAGGGSFQMSPGWQTLQLHHPEYETVEEYVELEPGQSSIRVFHFERIVRVKTDGPSGRIWIDGRKTEHTTPGALTVEPGRYSIRVRIPGHTVSGGKIINYSSDLDQVIPFGKGNTKSVFVKPAFQETAYELVFHAQETGE